LAATASASVGTPENVGNALESPQRPPQLTKEKLEVSPQIIDLNGRDGQI
jgi:hypothetical protein